MVSYLDVLVLTDPTGPHIRRIENVASMINGSQRYFRLEVRPSPSASGRASVDARSVAFAHEAAHPDRKIIVVIDAPLDDNWFSHEYRDSAVITMDDWEAHYAPPSLKAYLTYQIAQALMHFAADMSEEMAMNVVHEPAMGCMYDLSIHKPDIRLGMVAGNLCYSCEGQLKALGTEDAAIDAVRRILLLVRAEATGRPVTIEPSQVFVVMRFSSSDENDNAWKYGLKPGIERSGLTAVRGDDRVETRHLLEKVSAAIKKSRAILVKVDEHNLNVFFELGLALGLDKDVLLVSETTLSLNLPSDLRGWECLTYEHGNYDQLSERVQRFYADFYRL